MQLILQHLPGFMLVLCRMSAFFTVAPPFSTRGVPARFKAGLSVLISFLVYQTAGIGQPVELDGLYLLAVVREILAGLLIGFAAYLFFAVAQTAGSFVDLQLGFGMANVVDPLTGVSTPVLGNFKYMFAVLIFLTIDGHHLLLSAAMRSYEWIPLGKPWLNLFAQGAVTEFLVRTFTDTFLLAFQMSAPLIVSLFLTDVAFGFLARTAPQFNVFILGLPTKQIIGFLLLLLLTPGLFGLFQQLYASMIDSLGRLFAILQSGS
jgi:flagellar biosynthetic protein FliR